jgi:hypothetical protein
MPSSAHAGADAAARMVVSERILSSRDAIVETSYDMAAPE